MIVTSQRPGVFSSYTVTSLSGARTSAQYAAVVAGAQTGVPGKAYRFTTPDAVSAELGGGALAAGAKLLLECGVSQVVCIAAFIGEETEEADWDTAFAAVEELENIGAVVCGSVSAAVQAKLSESIARSCIALKERIGLVCADTAESAQGLAAALNNERICLCFPASVYKGQTGAFFTACAFAGALLLSGAGENLSGCVCNGIGLDGGNLAETVVQTLLGAGVAVFETVGGGVECIKAVTTRTKNGGTEDYSLANIATVRTIDHILQRARARMKAVLHGAKSNAATMQSIVAQMTVLLAEALDEGLVSSFETPRAALLAQDPSVCEVTLSFAAATAINQIHIVAHVQI